MPPSASALPDVYAACRSAQDWLASRTDEMAATLTDWAECNTGSSNQSGLLQLADTISDYAANFLPVSPQRLTAPDSDEVCALLWQYDSGTPDAPRVLLNGHIDTVFGPEHPFQHCHRSDDGQRLHGPGVADMKGGLVILLNALQALLRSELRDQLAWEVLLTFDEEVGSDKNAAHLAAAAERNDLGIVFESSPEHGQLIRNRLGTGKVEVVCHGQAAHAGRNFSDGRNAILALGAFLADAAELNTTLPGSIVNAGAITGGGPINVVPDHATAALNVRAPSPAIQEELMTRLHALANETATATGCRLEVSGGFTRPAKVADAATERLLEAWHAVGAMLEVDIHWRDTGGASDGNLLAHAGLPVVDNLGAVGTHLHSDAEFTELPRLVDRAVLSATFLLHLAAGLSDGPLGDILSHLRNPSHV